MRRSRQNPTPARATRAHLNFETRSVQLIAAWTLAMGGLGAAQHLLPARGAGASAPAAVSLSAPAASLPPHAVRLPRK